MVATDAVDLITVAEAATRYKLPVSTIHDWIQKGKLTCQTRSGAPYTRAVYVLAPADIEELIARKTP